MSVPGSCYAARKDLIMEPVFACPHCGYQGVEAFSECPDCGIVVEKYLALRAFGESAGRTPTRPPTRDADADVPGFFAQWTRSPEDVGTAGMVLRGVLLAILAVWGAILILAPLASNGAGASFLHLVNLPFHEAGHIIFSPFGRFVTSLGGTLGQLLVPLLCGATLLWKSSDPFGASVCLWWFGENFVDIAPYVNDARAGVLPLIGGNTGRGAPYGFHDWEYLLNETGLLRYDHQIATGSHAAGTLLMVAAIAWGVLILMRYFGRMRTEREFEI